MAVDDMLIKLAKTFPKTKPQTVFLINNYDMTIAILKVWIIICFSLLMKQDNESSHLFNARPLKSLNCMNGVKFFFFFDER